MQPMTKLRPPALGETPLSPAEVHYAVRIGLVSSYEYAKETPSGLLTAEGKNTQESHPIKVAGQCY